MEKTVVNLDRQICILNPKQAAYYWLEHNISPLNIYPSRDTHSGQPVIIFVFNRDETYSAYQSWINRKPVI